MDKDDAEDTKKDPSRKKQEENRVNPISFENIPDNLKVTTTRKLVGNAEYFLREAEKSREEIVNELSLLRFDDQIEVWNKVGDVLEEFPRDYNKIPLTGRAYLENMYYVAHSGCEIAEDHYKAFERQRQYIPPPFYTSSEVATSNIAQSTTTEILVELAENPIFLGAREKWTFKKRIQKNEELEELLKEIDIIIAQEFSNMWTSYQDRDFLEKILFPCPSGQSLFDRLLDKIAPKKAAEEQPYSGLARSRFGSLGTRIVFAICNGNLIDITKLPLMSFFDLLNNMNLLVQQFSSIKTQRIDQLSRDTQFKISSFLEVLQSLLLDLLTQRKVCTSEPMRIRLFPNDIDNFKRIEDVTPEMVKNFLDQVPNWAEKDIKDAFHAILGEPYSKKDWGGEGNDLYSWNVQLYGIPIPAAFLLKGRKIKSPKMRIKDCGKNGDQIVRLFEAPAELFVIQYVRGISEELIKDVEDKVLLKRSQNKRAWYLIMNGQDTARLLMAYDKLPPPNKI